MTSITKKDIQPDGLWIQESTAFRNHLIENNTSDVVFLSFEKEALYHLFRKYDVVPIALIDEVGTSAPLSQRVIGAHGEGYDNNFLICRGLGYSVINLRLSHILDKPYVNRFYCNDQQHAFMYEYNHINLKKPIDMVDFKKALKSVISENGTPEDNPILLEMQNWIEKAEENGVMDWSQVEDSDKFPLLKKQMEKPMVVEFTYTYNRAATNKTQKINDNPYGWGDYQCLRNQLTHNEELYEVVFTKDGKLDYFIKEAKNNIFFSNDQKTFIKRQYFATNAQPDRQEYNGEIEAAFLKLLISFIDDNGNINFGIDGITKLDFSLIKDGSMYCNLENYSDKWDKLNEQLMNEETAEETKQNIEKLRDYFFEYLKGITPLAKGKGKGVHTLNQHFSTTAKEYGKHQNGNDKAVLNIKDMRLTKLENALWVMKNSIILSELYTEKTAQPLSSISADYINTFKLNIDDLLDLKTQRALDVAGSGSVNRWEYLSLWNNKIFKILSTNLKGKKVVTDPALRKKHNDLFNRAKARTKIGRFLNLDGYYFCPVQNKMLDETNTDLGHDLLKKFGRKANMETTFIQNRSKNREYNKGNFPSPENYYVNILNTYDNALNNKEYVDSDTAALMEVSKTIISEVIGIYKNKEHLSL